MITIGDSSGVRVLDELHMLTFGGFKRLRKEELN